MNFLTSYEPVTAAGREENFLLWRNAQIFSFKMYTGGGAPKNRHPTDTMVQVKRKAEGAAPRHFGKYPYSLSSWALHEKIDTILIFACSAKPVGG